MATDPMTTETATMVLRQRDELAVQIAALTAERDALLKRHFVTGSIPAGPTTDDTEIVFVDGRAFVNAAKHEETVGMIAAHRDTAQGQVSTLLEAIAASCGHIERAPNSRQSAAAMRILQCAAAEIRKAAGYTGGQDAATR